MATRFFKPADALLSHWLLIEIHDDGTLDCHRTDRVSHYEAQTPSMEMNWLKFYSQKVDQGSVIEIGVDEALLRTPHQLRANMGEFAVSSDKPATCAEVW